VQKLQNLQQNFPINHPNRSLPIWAKNYPKPLTLLIIFLYDRPFPLLFPLAQHQAKTPNGYTASSPALLQCAPSGKSNHAHAQILLAPFGLGSSAQLCTNC
jgi:hypothetical protein